MEKKRKPKRTPKVLVIDDEKDLCLLFKRVLGEEGYKVFTAHNGFLGIKKNRENNPDVIILDLKMPKMSGIETLRNIRKKDKKVKVIILTGYGSAETIREAVALDVHEYVSKPFNNEVIKRIIKEALASIGK